MARTFAAADIGSNTVHLLVAESDGKSTQRLENESEWLALGEVVARQGTIPPELVQQLMRTLTRFGEVASTRKAERLYVFATEAMRRAKNHNEILNKVSQELGVTVEIITGRREAELALMAAHVDSLDKRQGALFDIGGGSAQVARFDENGITDEASMPIGTGALMASWSNGSPPSNDEAKQTKQSIDQALSACASFGKVEHAIGSGGVARGMVRALHPDGDRTLQSFELDFLERTLSGIPSQLASKRFAVGSKRAVSLLPGVWVMQTLMARFNLQSIKVSEFSLRDGAIMAMATGDINGDPV